MRPPAQVSRSEQARLKRGFGQGTARLLFALTGATVFVERLARERHNARNITTTKSGLSFVAALFLATCLAALSVAQQKADTPTKIVALENKC